MLPSETENYFDRCEIRFLDSFSFMPSSLDKLAENLSDNHLHINQNYYKNDDTFKTMRKKGIYPYEYMDSFERYNETILPSISKFYDKLNRKECSQKEYMYANLVWNKMKCASLEDYTRIYMTNDVLLLADVFENFRNLILVGISLLLDWLGMLCLKRLK